MEILYAFGGIALCILAVGFLIHGYPKITIIKKNKEKNDL